MDQKKIIAFYDNYVQQQIQVGINERIYSLYKRILKMGLPKNATILELGCGIGILTNMLSRHVNQGSIEAVDISPESIRYAKSKIKRKNISFSSADILTYVPSNKNPTYITLFDILEHIPLNQHQQLFEHIALYCGYETRILINIPNPEYLKYLAEQPTANLQIVDQPIPIPNLIRLIGQAGFDLHFYETYSIWDVSDYTFICLNRKKPFEIISLSSKRNLFQKIANRLERIYFRKKNGI